MHRTAVKIALALGLVLALTGCPESNEDYVQLYAEDGFAPSLTETSVAALDHLGPTLIDQGANFGVYSENATRIELLLFDDPESDRPTRRIPMRRFGNVWNIYIEGVGLGQHYGYIAWGPNWTYDPDWYPGSILGFNSDVDALGNRFNPNKLLSDPYSVALHRDHDWLRGSLASGPGRQDVTWGAGTKSVIVQSEYEWSETALGWVEARKNGELEGQDWHDSIIYEVHLKGFTASPASGVLHPGTFRGMGEKADYFADLGITAVELLPIMEKPLDGTYWGYNTINFFAPEITYASKKERNEVIDEFKWMVDQLHQRGIAVILDVVYNHTGEGGFWRSKIAQDDYLPDNNIELVNHDEKEVSSIYNMRGLDNKAYYALEDDPQFFLNQTGVGNQCRTDHTPMKKLIMDNLRYWVEEFHVDGFRFDLAPILAVPDGSPDQWDAQNTVIQEIIDDPYFQDNKIKMISEPWSLPHFKLGAFPKALQGDTDQVGWYEWNAHFRDVWRSFMNVDEFALSQSEGSVDVGGSLTGSAGLLGWNERKPYHSVNFVTAHDGFTLYDLFTYNEKRNLCGPLNPICCDQPTNPFCDPNSGDNHNRSRDWVDEDYKRQLIRNMFVAMLISHGTPMILGGDEWMRTQLGNNNAYSTSSDNPFNWFNWGAWQADPDRVRMHDFVRQMIQFRKENLHAFSPKNYDGVPFAWKDAANNDKTDWGNRHVAMHYYDKTNGPELLVLINMEAGDVEFTLPEGTVWLRTVDTQAYFESDAFMEGRDAASSPNIDLELPEAITGSYGVKSRSIVILKGT